MIVAGPRPVAFQHDYERWLAPPGGVVLLSDGGALLKVIARQPLGSDYFVAGGDPYFIVRGATSGQTDGAETVYVMRPGARAATALHREAVQLGGCAQGASPF